MKSLQRSKEAPGSLAYPITSGLTAEKVVLEILMHQYLAYRLLSGYFMAA